MSNGSVTWLRAWPDDRTPEFRVGRCDGQLVAEWANLGTLFADQASSKGRFEACSAGTSPALERLHHREIPALLGHLRGECAFHAAAASVGGAAVVFLGGSGAGKSSLTASLCHHLAAAFISDDITRIDDEEGAFFVHSNESHSCLHADSLASFEVAAEARGKTSLSPPRRAEAPARLAALIKLEFDDGAAEPRLVRLGGQHAFETLSQSMIRFVFDDPALALRDFELLSKILARTPAMALRRPRRLNGLRHSAEVVASFIEQGSPR